MDPISSQPQPTDAEPALVVSNLCKLFTLYAKPIDRLWQALGKHSANTRHFHALTDISFSLAKGEVVGVVGRNGAGKSTLLQLICGTLNPSSGSVKVNGRIAALLELGSGFNPEFTGRDNVFMNAAVLGLSRAEIEAKYDDIVDFAELAAFMDQPVKTYSSGMLVRLAFAVATSVEPDILIIDEALSVGDGVFARKSFDRIMEMRNKGVSILFCSHSLYQIEALCHRAIWLHQGELIMDGDNSQVVKRYETFLHSQDLDFKSEHNKNKCENGKKLHEPVTNARISNIVVRIDDTVADLNNTTTAISGLSEMKVIIDWVSNPNLPTPSVAITIHANDGRLVASAGSHIDRIQLKQSITGNGSVCICFHNLPLLKGDYWIEAYLLCEQGIFFYDQRIPAARFKVIQPNYELEQGLVHLNRAWSCE